MSTTSPDPAALQAAFQDSVRSFSRAATEPDAQQALDSVRDIVATLRIQFGPEFAPPPPAPEIAGLPPEVVHHLRAAVSALDAEQPGDGLASLAPLTPEKEAQLYLAVADGLVPPGMGHITLPDDLDDVQQSVEERFGRLFNEFAAEVSRPAGAHGSGHDGLLSLLQSTPTPSEAGIQSLRESPDVRGAGDLGDRMAAQGVSPLLVLRAGLAVGDLLTLEAEAGRLPTPWEVVLDEHGHLAPAHWPRESDDAISIVAEACRLPRPTATAVLRWLVAASEVSPHLFGDVLADVSIGPRGGDTRAVRLSALPPDDADFADPLHAWDPAVHGAIAPVPDPA